MLNHAGRTDTRAFSEVAQLGAELEKIGDRLRGTRVPARVALLFDWDSWWALEIADGHSRALKYEEQMVRYHRALWSENAGVDVVGVHTDLDGYDLVVAPLLHMIKGDLAERLDAVLARGGSVVTTVMSGRVDEDGNAFLADVPGPLAGAFGVRVDETDSLPPDAANTVVLQYPGEPEQVHCRARHVFDVILPQDADVIGRYADDFYAGAAAVTRSRRRGGNAWYVGTVLDQDGVDWVIRRALAEQGLRGHFADVPDIEHTTRQSADARFEFILNHSDDVVTLVSPFGGRDHLSDRLIEVGDALEVGPHAVLLIEAS